MRNSMMVTLVGYLFISLLIVGCDDSTKARMDVGKKKIMDQIMIQNQVEVLQSMPVRKSRTFLKVLGSFWIRIVFCDDQLSRMVLTSHVLGMFLNEGNTSS